MAALERPSNKDPPLNHAAAAPAPAAAAAAAAPALFRFQVALEIPVGIKLRTDRRHRVVVDAVQPTGSAHRFNDQQVRVSSRIRPGDFLHQVFLAPPDGSNPVASNAGAATAADAAPVWHHSNGQETLGRLIRQLVAAPGVASEAGAAAEVGSPRQLLFEFVRQIRPEALGTGDGHPDHDLPPAERVSALVQQAVAMAGLAERLPDPGEAARLRSSALQLLQFGNEMRHTLAEAALAEDDAAQGNDSPPHSPLPSGGEQENIDGSGGSNESPQPSPVAFSGLSPELASAESNTSNSNGNNGDDSNIAHNTADPVANNAQQSPRGLSLEEFHRRMDQQAASARQVYSEVSTRWLQDLANRPEAHAALDQAAALVRDWQRYGRSAEGQRLIGGLEQSLQENGVDGGELLSFASANLSGSAEGVAAHREQLLGAVASSARNLKADADVRELLGDAAGLWRQAQMDIQQRRMKDSDAGAAENGETTNSASEAASASPGDGADLADGAVRLTAAQVSLGKARKAIRPSVEETLDPGAVLRASSALLGAVQRNLTPEDMVRHSQQLLGLQLVPLEDASDSGSEPAGLSEAQRKEWRAERRARRREERQRRLEGQRRAAQEFAERLKDELLRWLLGYLPQVKIPPMEAMKDRTLYNLSDLDLSGFRATSDNIHVDLGQLGGAAHDSIRADHAAVEAAPAAVAVAPRPPLPPKPTAGDTKGNNNSSNNNSISNGSSPQQPPPESSKPKKWLGLRGFSASKNPKPAALPPPSEDELAVAHPPPQATAASAPAPAETVAASHGAPVAEQSSADHPETPEQPPLLANHIRISGREIACDIRNFRWAYKQHKLPYMSGGGLADAFADDIRFELELALDRVPKPRHAWSSSSSPSSSSDCGSPQNPALGADPGASGDDYSAYTKTEDDGDDEDEDEEDEDQENADGSDSGSDDEASSEDSGDEDMDDVDGMDDKDAQDKEVCDGDSQDRNGQDGDSHDRNGQASFQAASAGGIAGDGKPVKFLNERGQARILAGSQALGARVRTKLAELRRRRRARRRALRHTEPRLRLVGVRFELSRIRLKVQGSLLASFYNLLIALFREPVRLRIEQELNRFLELRAQELVDSVNAQAGKYLPQLLRLQRKARRVLRKDNVRAELQKVRAEALSAARGPRPILQAGGDSGDSVVELEGV